MVETPQGAGRVTSYSRDGLSFDVLDTGPMNGEVIILLHGFPQRASSWIAVMRRLNSAGYRTIAPDQRGYSRGARPRGRCAYRVEALRADILALVEAVGIGPVHLVGHDWGACVAYVTAARDPSLVRSLTTVSVPHPNAFVRSMLVSTQVFRSWYMAFFQFPFLPELLIRRFPAATQRLLARTGMPRLLLDRFAEEIVRDGALPGALNYYRAMPLIGRRRRIVVPTTHVWSTRDTLLGIEGARLNRRCIVGPYELVVLEGVSHWVPDERPDELATVVLSRVMSAAGA